MDQATATVSCHYQKRVSINLHASASVDMTTAAEPSTTDNLLRSSGTSTTSLLSLDGPALSTEEDRAAQHRVIRHEKITAAKSAIDLVLKQKDQSNFLASSSIEELDQLVKLLEQAATITSETSSRRPISAAKRAGESNIV